MISNRENLIGGTLASLATASVLAIMVAGCTTRGDSRLADKPPADNETVVVTGTRSVTSVDIREERLASPAPPSPPAMVMSAPVGRVMAAPNVAQHGWIAPVMVPQPGNTERYDGKDVSPVHQVAAEPVSTFSVDVDTGAYANARRFLTAGQLPPRDAVRSEELVNYFRYDYARPGRQETPFTITTDLARTPWNADTRLLRIGLRGYDIPSAQRPPANLVFLIDVSGSMQNADKLPLVKTALAGLASELGPKDKVSIVVYAGAAGMVLEPTNDPRKIRDALDRLLAGSSTAGGAGLQLAYQIARDNFIKGGVNRILLATDGDFNVGTSDTRSLIQMVEHERDSGITLTTLGFGEGNYNEGMMEQIADHGNGNYAYIDSALEAKKVLGDEMGSTLFTIAKDVKIQVEFNPAQVSQYRLLGYENRALREEDFNNDKVDAGDIGAGHQVTAIYEIVPTGAKGWTDPHRYAPTGEAKAGRGSEIAYVKLRYKLPDGTTSRLVEQPVPAALMARAGAPTGDFAFAAAVAAFSQKLRGDPLMNGYSFRQVAALAGPQENFWRQEFIRLVGVADGIGDRLAER